MRRSAQHRKLSEGSDPKSSSELTSRDVVRLLMRTVVFPLFERTDCGVADAVRERAQPLIDRLVLQYAALWRVYGRSTELILKSTAEREGSSVADVKKRLVETALLEVMCPDLERFSRPRSGSIPVFSRGAQLEPWLRRRVLAKAKQLAADLSEDAAAPDWSEGVVAELPDHGPVADPERALERRIAEKLVKQISSVATPAQWRAVEKLDKGEALSAADRNALYHLRRKLEERGISPANTSLL